MCQLLKRLYSIFNLNIHFGLLLKKKKEKSSSSLILFISNVKRTKLVIEKVYNKLVSEPMYMLLIKVIREVKIIYILKKALKVTRIFNLVL